MHSMTSFFTELMRRYLPDPFVFAIGLTILTMGLAIVVEQQSVATTIDNWGAGFWNLLGFTTQMAVILVMGYVLARAPLVDALLSALVSQVQRPATAVVVATLVGGVASYINWGFGLVVGGIVAKKLALKLRDVHYPLIIASAYSGFTLYGIGLSATIPIVISSKGHALADAMGVIPLRETIFSAPMLLAGLALLITLPVLNVMMLPRRADQVVPIDPALAPAEQGAAGAPAAASAGGKTLASRLNDSRLLSLAIGAVAAVYLYRYFAAGKAFDVNIINFVILFAGIVLLGTPARYVEMLNEGIKAVGGVILQYPFYAGLMAIMAGSGLVESISHAFVDISTPHTLTLWGIVSSFLINFFAPSAGGHWVVQGPFMIAAAHSLGAPLNQTAMAVMLGNAWNDLVQPFWLLPALALSRLHLKDIMGYTVVHMLWVGAVYSVTLLIWARLG
ncbi:Putative short-chain fatty acid transporter [Cupriavidus laharis]|uniref:Short-chain fatty acid transporter n=1 Tax=Cupriavidus laharis TaxID=151654 RepID=A0ABN7Z1W7_9BURK|nr:TIGR00366 family protein [Cupriavidus laharis]CAG9179792.1 Putative short-chain fatty acid transporter [Cupriavidus laharis]